MNLFNFFFITYFYFIYSEREFQLWEKNQKLSSVGIPNLININSYIFDPLSRAELYLINDNNELYFKNETYETSITNNLRITDLKPSLINIYSNYYFCSSSLNQMIMIEDKKLKPIQNPSKIQQISGNYSINCFLSWHYIDNYLKERDAIMIAYIGTPYLYFYYPLDQTDPETEINYVYSYTFEDENKNFRNIIGINNCINDPIMGKETETFFIALIYGKNEENINNYFFFYFKKTNYLIYPMHPQKPFRNSSLVLYDIVEVSSRNMYNQNERLGYIFSYNPGKKDYIFYSVNLPGTNKDEINGNYYFRFFNGVKINYAKFIDDTALLYYDIESLYDGKNYIGVADLEYFLLIYNIEEKPNSKLYFNFGNYFKNIKSEELLYFNGEYKISYCPFIEEEEKCYFTYNYFDISEIKHNIFKNYNSGSCLDKKVMGPYCVSDCPLGFQDDDISCSFCSEYIFIKKYVSFNNKKCLEVNSCTSIKGENGICYDCISNQTYNEIYYREDCLQSCEDSFSVKNENGKENCTTCKDDINHDNKTYYSFLSKSCVSRDECLEKAEERNISDDLFFCKECAYINSSLSLFKFKGSKGECIDKCPDFFVNLTGSCQLCEDLKTTPYYQRGECKKKCDIEGFAFKNQELTKYNYNITICENCSSFNWFIQEDECVSMCAAGYYISDINKRICESCEDKYYLQIAEKCVENCPKGSRKSDNNCIFCTKDEFYIEKDGEGQCITDCNQEVNTIETSFEKYYYSYNTCTFCNESQIFANGKCIECTGGYLYNNEICYQCFCGHENFTCYEGTSQCDCSNSSNYYGYSCQFYSEDDINEQEMIIVSMNGNKLIKTGPNFFTYSLKNNIKLSQEYSFEWKLYIDNMEITGNNTFKEIFITSNKEAVFGIKKDIFENNNYKDFKISLYIYHNKNIKYKHTISLIIIESFEYENQLNRGENSNLELKELIRNLELENKKDEEKIYKGKYYFQYGLIDKNNERIPLTNYIDSEKIDINVICSKGYYINIKNDREEIRRNEITLTNCRALSLKLDEILNSSFSLFKAEQILLLISNLRINNYDEIDDNSVSELFNFIKQSISIMIKSDGYWEDDNKDKAIKNITYSEPKLIFSLIYHLSNLIKKDLIKKSSINNFFDLYDKIFEEVFKYDPISNKTLSDSDIKSLFRTIDNLYDISIKKDLNSDNGKNSIETHFIQTLDYLSKYLAYISYPSQTNELRGKRISFFTYNLGLYENSISFPYIFKNFDAELNDLSTYIHNDWYLNEQQSCEQKKMVSFCLNKDNFLNLKNKIFNNNNVSNTYISIYLLPEINSANEKNDPAYDDEIMGDDEEIEKIPVNKNYSIIFKLFKNENEHIIEVTDKTYVRAEFEFPFHLNADKKEPEQKKKSGLDKYGLNVTESPDNSDHFCHTNNMYNNSVYKYPCFTHFDYTHKIVRCSCNITSGDAIAVLKDSSFAKDVIDEQFQKESFSLSYKYILFIVYFFIFLLIIPEIFYLIHDIKKESKIINENRLTNIEDERKKSYIEAKKYHDKGVLSFSFYLTLDKFPYFSVFNKNYSTYPKFLRHIVISIGLLIGFIMPIVPYLFISFSERDIFIGQRDIEFMDSDIEKIPSDKYKILSLCFSLLGIIFGNLFIYIFSKILNYEKDELDIWLKIKTICKDYIYYDIKSEVLLGAVWNKIKLRMISYYYICGKYILKHNKKINKNNDKFNQYLSHASRNYEYKKSITNNFDDLGRILPSISRESNNNSLNISGFNSSRTEKSFEMGNVENEGKEEEKDILLDKKDNDDLQKKRAEIQRKYMKRVNQKIRININLQICKMDNFKLDKNIKYDKSKRQIARFEKVRNRYIYVHKKSDINEIEIDEPSYEDKNSLVISQQNNYFYTPNKSFINVNKVNNLSNSSNNIILKFIIISAILMTIFSVLIIITLYLVKKVLNKFDKFILKAWIIPLIFVIIFLNFILYYLKMLIASVLIFHYYNLRKKNCFIKFLFWVFVDKAMIQIYKVKNLITKYKKEFDYLQN